MPREPRLRLDLLLAARGLAENRSRAQALVMAGAVQVEGQPVTKPGHPVAADARIEVAGAPPVSRAGGKLGHALSNFAVAVTGRCCADIGSSTGGFTECLLERGARRVYAIDVGTNQLHERLRAEPRVTVMEQTNARTLTPADFPERPDLAVMDVSFISNLKLLPALVAILTPPGELVCLVKPPFEAEPQEVGRGGRVTGVERHRAVLTRWAEGARALGASLTHFAVSPVRGGKSANVEYLARLLLTPAPGTRVFEWPQVEAALTEVFPPEV